jgi:serine/threonine-protein kinase
MSVVFRAFDADAGGDVALKLLVGGTETDAEERARFRREAAIQTCLDHPAIVRTLGTGCARGVDYIAMELVPGRDLGVTVRDDGPLEPKRALGIVRTIALALESVHTLGILHRDVKPQNILLRPDGSPVLMDFGLAGWEALEAPPVVGSIGTPLYAPPEQADLGGDFGLPTAASDVYGLGATLYFLLTRLHPFAGNHADEVRWKVLRELPVHLRRIAPHVPAPVAALCHRCLAKKPADRFPSAAALARAIEVLN